MVQRLDKLLASQGTQSRRDAQRRIRSGAVTVDGSVCRDPAAKVDPDRMRIDVAGESLRYRQHLYIMLNKPPGILCVSRDPKARTVVDLLPDPLRRKGLFPAGRLDKDTVGLVLLTDDGDYAHRILSPKKQIEKCYHARVDGPILPEHIEAFRQGTSLEDGTVCRPAMLRVLEDGEPPLTEVVITEGRYHQIKRMFASAGRQVLWLKRVSIGELALDARLAEGESRELTDTEREAVFAGLPHNFCEKCP